MKASQARTWLSSMYSLGWCAWRMLPGPQIHGRDSDFLELPCLGTVGDHLGMIGARERHHDRFRRRAILGHEARHLCADLAWKSRCRD